MTIVATVGTQLPFPRLIKALDRIAGSRGLTVIAQTCENLPGLFNIEQHAFLAPAQFETAALDARIIVGHAGIGTVLSAERMGKPLIIFPRRASLGEHRNEHQLATANALKDRQGIYVAETEDELEHLLTSGPLVPLVKGESAKLAGLIDALRGIIAAA